MATGEKQLASSSLGDDVEVAIIGNGPSSIALSFLLSGYRPYWNGQEHPIEYLASKLSECEDRSILEQDLEFLSEGLYGRSSNAVSLLFDQLLLPNADLGTQSAPVVRWRYHPELAVNHVVLGRGCVGGSWAGMPADLQSLSYAQWLQLPDMPIADFINHLSKSEAAASALDRGRCGVVAHYYQQYVRRKGLHTRFVCGAEVTHVRRLDHADVEEVDGCSPYLPILQQCHCCVSPPPSCCSVLSHDHPYRKPDSPSTTNTTTIDTVTSKPPPSPVRMCTMASSQSPSPHPSSSSPHLPLSPTSSSSSSGMLVGNCTCTSTSSSESIYSNSSVLSDESSLPCTNITRSDSSSSSSSSASSSPTAVAEEHPTPVLGTLPITNPSSSNFNWSICGCYSRKPFRFNAKQVVLAVGTSDEPRRLNVPGEGLDLLNYGCPTPGRLRSIAGGVSHDKPLVVVGCGLTAADTILLALQHHLPVVHVFGRAVSDTSLALHRMPRSVYPEYSRVSKLMQTRVAQTDKPLVFDADEPYISLPLHHIISVSPQSCTLQDAQQTEVILPCSHIFVAAGSRPNLSFLPQSGQNLAFEPAADFDCRVNPVDINPITFESTRTSDLYAMGPLVGDNFVRFAIGGSLGITKSLVSKLRQSASDTA